MFYHDKRTQYTVRVDSPSSVYAKMLQLEQMRAGKEQITAVGMSSMGISAGSSGGSTSSDGIVTRIHDSLSAMANHLAGGTQSGTNRHGIS